MHAVATTTYFVTAVSYNHKLLITLTPRVIVIKHFFFVTDAAAKKLEYSFLTKFFGLV